MRKTILISIIVVTLIIVGYKQTDIMNTQKNTPKYKNPVPTTVMQKGKGWDTFKRMISSSERTPEKDYSFTTDLSKIDSLKSELKVIWLGHSSLYIEIEGTKILCDPVWSQRSSPTQLTGPKRFFENPIPLKDLPKPDAVIISHDHYDHLDKETVKYLAAKGIVFYTPVGVSNRLEKWGIAKTQIKAFNWWDSIKVGSVSITAAPSCHFSGRGLSDRNSTLWASWVIQNANHKIFFSGDSGYYDGFKEIGEKYGPFDLTFIEIGASDENWKDIHMGPANAIQTHIDLKGKTLIPIHWGTFNLALHPWKQPAEEVLRLSKEKNVNVIFPEPGEVIDPGNYTQKSFWWEN